MSVFFVCLFCWTFLGYLHIGNRTFAILVLIFLIMITNFKPQVVGLSKGKMKSRILKQESGNYNLYLNPVSHLFLNGRFGQLCFLVLVNFNKPESPRKREPQLRLPCGHVF